MQSMNLIASIFHLGIIGDLFFRKASIEKQAFAGKKHNKKAIRNEDRTTKRRRIITNEGEERRIITNENKEDEGEGERDVTYKQA